MFDLRHIAVCFAIAAAATLAGCGGEADPVEQVQSAGVPGMSVTNARMVLAPVKGHPAAVYFDLDYEGDRALTIRKASVADAKSSMMHGYGETGGKMSMMEAVPIGIVKGTKVEFKPGALHIMAMDVSPDLQPGATTEVTLTVSGGGTYSFPVEVRAAGDER